MGSLPFRDPPGADFAPVRPVSCPFHDGPQTLDLLLGELRHDRPDLIDLALELRSAMTSRADAEHCIRLLFALRTSLAGHHHLAFYRVRMWVRQHLVAEVRPDGASPWSGCPVPLDCARYEELVNRCLATLAEGANDWPIRAEFRLGFT